MRAPVTWLRRVVGFEADEPYRADMARLSVARFISMTGSQVAYVALVAVMYQRSGGSGVWVSAALVVIFGLRALVSPWSGALGDRFDRRRVLIASDIASAATFVGIAFAHSPLLLVVIAGFTALAEAPFQSTSAAFLVMLVPESQRAWATATRSSSAAAGIILGGLVGGLLVATLGGAGSFLINAASFVLSAAFVSRIRGVYRAEQSADDSHAGVWAGVRFIARTRALRLVVMSSGAVLLGVGMVNVAEYPLFVSIGSGSFAWGAAVAGWGVGQLVGSRVSRRMGSAYAERQGLLLGGTLLALALGASGLVPVAGVLVVLFTIAGFGASVSRVAVTLITQRWTPDPIRARVFAASGAIAIGSIGISMTIGGVLIASLTPPGVCVAAGVVGVIGAAISFGVPPRRRPPTCLEPEEAPKVASKIGRWLMAT